MVRLLVHGPSTTAVQTMSHSAFTLVVHRRFWETDPCDSSQKTQIDTLFDVFAIQLTAKLLANSKSDAASYS